MSSTFLANVMVVRRTRLRLHLVTLFVATSALLSWVGCGPPEPMEADASGGDVIDWVADSDVELPMEFPLSVGHYWPAGATFEPLESGQELEIVQGFQGGVHTEIAFELDLGLSYASTQIVYFDVHVQTWLDGSELVAERELANYKAGNIGFGVFQSQTVPVIFDQNEAVHYVDRDALIFAQLTLEGDVSAQAIPVRLIDTRNETLPQ